MIIKEFVMYVQSLFKMRIKTSTDSHVEIKVPFISN